MILQVFAVRDIKSESYSNPFYLARAEVAVRTFKDAMADKTHPMAQHPEDYQLYHLGNFNDDTGAFESKTPFLICTHKDL